MNDWLNCLKRAQLDRDLFIAGCYANEFRTDLATLHLKGFAAFVDLEDENSLWTGKICI